MDVDSRQYEHMVINNNDVHNIILSYLLHNCFKETAEAFISCSGISQSTDYLVEMDRRKPIFHSAMEGNALKAIELTKELSHDLLEKNQELHFDLLSLHFVELVCLRKWDYRQNVADSLNSAILAHSNLASYPSLERLIQQTAVVRQYLSQEVGKDGPPPFSLRAFLKS